MQINIYKAFVAAGFSPRFADAKSAQAKACGYKN
jgi:hypothetical protein